MPTIGKFLIIAGLMLILFGVVFTLWDKIPFLGRLPGDLIFKRGNTILYIPIVTCIVLSILLTLILNMIGRK
jgi:hypothetical protein